MDEDDKPAFAAGGGYAPGAASIAAAVGVGGIAEVPLTGAGGTSGLPIGASTLAGASGGIGGAGPVGYSDDRSYEQKVLDAARNLKERTHAMGERDNPLMQQQKSIPQVVAEQLQPWVNAGIVDVEQLFATVARDNPTLEQARRDFPDPRDPPREQQAFPWADNERRPLPTMRNELERLRALLPRPKLVRRLARELVDYGRQLGRAEVAALRREQLRVQLSAILDDATRTFPTSAAEATLEQWRDGRRQLYEALTRWLELLPYEKSCPNPVPGDAMAIEEELQRLLVRPWDDALPPRKRLLRRAGEWLSSVADYLDATRAKLEDRE